MTNEQTPGSMSKEISRNPLRTTDGGVWKALSLSDNPRGFFPKCNYGLNLNINHLLSLEGLTADFCTILEEKSEMSLIVFDGKGKEAPPDRDVRSIGIPIQSRLGI